jgi:hypothetical protein
MEIPQELVEKASRLIRSGMKIEAIKLLRDELNISLGRATSLARHLEMTDPSSRHKSPLNRSDFVMGFVGVLVLFVGLVGLYLIIKNVMQDLAFERTAIAITGTMIKIDQNTTTDDDGVSSTGYYPVFEYEINQKTYQTTSNVSLGEDNYEIGEEVPILIDPEDPEKIIVNTFTDRWMLYIILGAFALMFILMGAVATRLSIRH